MKIAVLGWGSLVPKPEDLPLNGQWQPVGPVLKIEFSRISSDGRLTLVIDPHGSEVATYYAESARKKLEDAVGDLRMREKTTDENVGKCSKDRSHNSSEKHPDVLPILQAWLDQTQFDAAIWTDLESNYKKKRGRGFEESDAFAYLKSLPPICQANARNYIIQGPEKTQTRFRRDLQSKGWL
jgi:hypothetical protein